MWIWPKRAHGFLLSLSPGLYVVPSHIAWSETQRLMWLLVEGLDDVEHGLELDWPGAERLIPQLCSASSTLSWLRVPSTVPREAAEALLQRLAHGRCFIQYEAAGVWPEFAWYERQVKDPLVSFLRRDLLREDHPLRELGVRELPVEVIAASTVDPIELLVILQATLTHRARSAHYGTQRDDWLRSIRRASADRLASRLRALPAELLQRALDLLLAHDDGLFSVLEDPEAAYALAHVGLVRHEGNDALVYPLAKLIHAPAHVGRLVEKLPEAAWSPLGKQHAREALPHGTPTLRPMMVVPDPCFADAALVHPTTCLTAVGDLVDEECSDGVADWIRRGLELLGELARGPAHLEARSSSASSIAAWRAAPARARASGERELHWREVIELCHRILAETAARDEVLELGFEDGFAAAFGGLDGLLAAEPKSTRRLLALVRWSAIRTWLEYAPDRAALDRLARVADDALAHAEQDRELALALQVMLGDLAVLRRCYREASEHYERASCEVPEALADALEPTLAATRLAVMLRLDDNTTEGAELWAQVQRQVQRAPSSYGSPRFVQVLSLFMSECGFNPGTLPHVEQFRRVPPPLSTDATTWMANLAQIAWHTTLGEWPAAIDRARHLFERIAECPHSHAPFVRLAWAWMKSIAGDLDVARDNFEELIAASERRGDRLLEAIARRGSALAASLDGAPNRAIAELSRAHELELELGMLDARIVALDLALARVEAGEAFASVWAAVEPSFEDLSTTTWSLAVGQVSRLLRMWARAPALAEFASPWDMLAAYTSVRSRFAPELRGAIIDVLDAALRRQLRGDISSFLAHVDQIAEGDEELERWLATHRPRL